MGFGEILDSSVRLYRENFIPLITAQLPLTLIYLVSVLLAISYGGTAGFSLFSLLTQSLTPQAPAPVQTFSYLRLSLIISAVQALVVYPLTVPAVMKIASGSILKAPVSVKEAYTFSKSRWLQFLFTHIVLGIAVGLTLLVVAIPIAIVIAVGTYSYATGASLGVILGAVLVVVIIAAALLVFPLFFWTRWMGTFPVGVNENTFILEGMGRSKELVKGYTIKTFFVLFVVFLIVYIVQFSPVVLEFTVQRSLAALTVVFGAAAQGLIVPLVDTTRVVLYFELKTRKEGFDLERRAEQLTKT